MILPLFRSVPLALAVAGLLTGVGAAIGQSRSVEQMGGQPARHQPGPPSTPPPAPAPTIPKYRGGILPGSLGRSPFSGIGTGRANIDLLSNPARDRVFTPVPVVLPPDRRPHDPRLPDGRWHHRRDRDHDSHDSRGRWNQPRFRPDSDFVITGGVSLFDGVYTGYGAAGNGYGYGGYGYGYGGYPTPVYPSPYGYSPYGSPYSTYSTSGLLSLPAPAVSYDALTGSYIYGYGNPFYPGLYGTGPYATAPSASPGAAQPESRPAPSAADIAAYQLSMDLPGRAVTTLSAYLKTSPDDARAMRSLAFALLQDRRLDDGVATLRNAYRMDPGLASEPVEAGSIGLDDDDLRDLVLRGVTYANRVDTGSSWLTVAVLMQAEGRTALAKNMLDKAEKKGLEAEVSTALRMAL